MKRKTKKTIYDPVYSNILKRMKDRRIEQGLSQGYVGEKLGKYQSFVSKIESGDRRVDIVELLKIADIYDTDINFFVQPESKKNKKKDK